MIERNGGLILLVTGAGLVVGGIAGAANGARIALCSLGAGMIVLAVVLGRMEGRVKVGPIETELRKSVDEQAKDLSASLAESELDDLTTVAQGARSLADVDHADRIRRTVQRLVATLDRLDNRTDDAAERSLASAFLEAAHGLMADHQWEGAARFFDRYVVIEPNNWDAQYSRAVAHANSRGGREADLAALRAFNDALTLRPTATKPNVIARLLSYRAAMLKRLRRLDEAEADLRVAEKKAAKKPEEDDIHYNLACVLAMQGKRDDALFHARALKGTPYVKSMRAYRESYFASLANDPEFLEVLA